MFNHLRNWILIFKRFHLNLYHKILTLLWELQVYVSFVWAKWIFPSKLMEQKSTFEPLRTQLFLPTELLENNSMSSFWCERGGLYTSYFGNNIESLSFSYRLLPHKISRPCLTAVYHNWYLFLSFHHHGDEKVAIWKLKLKQDSLSEILQFAAIKWS